MSVKRKSSEVWRFFVVLDDTLAKCDICKAKLSYKTSVTNLKKHIQRKHPSVQFLGSTSEDTPLLAEGPEIALRRPDTQAGPSTSNSERMVITDSSDNHLMNVAVTPSTDDAPATSFKIVEGTSLVRPNHQHLNEQPLVRVETSDSRKRKQSSIATFCQKKKLNLSDKKKIDNKLMLLFTQDMQPFRLVEHKGFRTFVAALNPMYELPSRHSISNNMLPALYEKCVLVVKEIISQVNTVCLTTDCWTSINNESFMGVTAHFVSDDFQLKSVLLDCVHLHVKHTSENLAKELKKIIDEWRLNGKVILVVSDNASNIKRTIRDELKLKFFGCFAHTINLIVNDALESDDTVTEVIRKIKTIVSHFKRSSNAQEKLVTYQQNSGKIPKKLKQDVSTRWNSTYYMVERFCELEEAVKTTLALLDKELPVLSQEEWQTAKELTLALKPFEEVTRTSSGEQYVTASMVITMTNGLEDVCKELKNKEFCAAVSTVVKKLEDGVGSRFADNERSQTLTISTFLDPRFKTEMFSCSRVCDSTTNEVRNAVAFKIAQSSEKFPEGNEEDEEGTEGGSNPSNDLSFWNFVKKAQKKAKPKGNAFSKAIIEVQRYLDDDIISIKKDPLKWWRENSYKYPFLSTIVKEKFCALATSVPCERLFSKGGLVLNEQRTRLTSSKARMILFVNGNIEHVTN